MRETQLVRAAVSFLRMRGIPAWRNNTGAAKASYAGKMRYIRYSVPGASDVFAVLPPTGRFLAAEAKVGNNKTTPEQDAFLDNVKRAGGLAVVFHTLDELADAIGYPLCESEPERSCR